MGQLFTQATPDFWEQFSVNNGPTTVTIPPMTIAAWFNSDDITNEQGIAGVFDHSNGTRHLVLCLRGDAGDVVGFQVRSGSTKPYADSASSYSANTWHHAIAVTASITSRFAGIDGVLGTEETTSVSVTGVDSTSIGMYRDSTPDRAFSGKIAEVGFWDVVLNYNEIRLLASGVRPIWIRPGHLKGYYQLWGPTIPIDQSGFGFHCDVANSERSVVGAAEHPPLVLERMAEEEFLLAKSAAVAEIITPDKWHPAIQQPYPYKKSVIPY